MGAFKDITGQRFGRLTVIERAEPDSHGRSHWLCRCECGTEKRIAAYHLSKGNIRSCGCLVRDILRQNRLTHGQCQSVEYEIWAGMKKRCANPRDRAYKNYGARGITVCDRWLSDFAAFYADMGECPPGYSIERIDNGGPYSPENCRWATITEQANNRRGNHWLTFEGRTMTLAQWAHVLGFPHYVIGLRLKYGWSVEDTLTRPLRPARR